jgi:hypothetical protein
MTTRNHEMDGIFTRSWHGLTAIKSQVKIVGNLTYKPDNLDLAWIRQVDYIYHKPIDAWVRSHRSSL